MQRCKLFCLPYAGGSSLVFSHWKKMLPPDVDLVPVEYSGRGGLSDKPSYVSTEEGACDIIRRFIDALHVDLPYCLFGQSLGGLLAFEMLQLLQDTGKPLPFHVFFSGIFPPHINKIHRKLHQLSDRGFIKQLKRWSSLPLALTDDVEMLNVWTRILKSDYQLLENYHFVPRMTPHPVDFTVLKGKDDHWYTREEYWEWQKYSDREIAFYEIEGGHFFIHDQKQEVISIIEDTINGYF